MDARTHATFGPARRHRSPAAAVVSSVALLVLVHVAYRALLHFTPLGAAELRAGLNFSPGVLMALASLGLMLSGGWTPREFGLSLTRWRSSLRIGVGWGIIAALGAGMQVWIGGFHVSAGKPAPDELALLGVAGYLGLTVAMLGVLRPPRPESEASSDVESFAPLATVATLLAAVVLILVFLAPAVAGARTGKSATHALAVSLELFLAVGFGEELLFRGSMLALLNHAFGRPYRRLGTTFGPGLFISAALFGLLHVFNTVDYFGGKWEFAWAWGAATVGSGLFLGLMRERTGSLAACVLAHAVIDTLLVLPTYLNT